MARTTRAHCATLVPRARGRLPALAFGEAVAVPAFDPRMVCTGCGIVGAHVRPNWQERAQRDHLTGVHLTGVQWR